MKRRILPSSLLALAVLTAGCTNIDFHTPKDVISTGGYLSPSVGKTWTYTVTVAAESSYSYTMTRTVAGTSTFGAKTYWKITETADNSGRMETSWFRIAGDYTYTLADSTGAEKPSFRFGVGRGRAWSPTPWDSIGVSEDMRYNGLEDIMIGTETYTDCAKFTKTVAIYCHPTRTYVDTVWLAPGIGPVKETHLVTQGTTTWSDITSLLSSHN